jgi:hypothetical protein
MEQYKTYHLGEYLIIDYLLWQAVYHQREVIEQTDADCSISTAEEPNNGRCDFGLEFIVGEFLADPHHGPEYFGTATTKLDGFEKLWEYFHFKIIFGEVV